MSSRVVIYTDGACSGNPGVGGWGAVLSYGEHTKEIAGYADNTTNNQMELKAVIEALKLLKRSCDVVVYTDSSYVQKGMTEWLAKWKKNGWRSSDKKEVKNKELWQELDAKALLHRVEWIWVKGHADNEGNNRADFLATEEIRKRKADLMGNLPAIQ